MKYRVSVCIILSLFLCLFIPLSYANENEDEDSLDEREMAIDDTLRWIEFTLEYGFATLGQQTFEVFGDVDGDGDQEIISRLEYPHRGGILIAKGEAGPWFGFSIGGRFGNSEITRELCSDEDWYLYDDVGWGPPDYGTDFIVEYQITRQMSESKVEFFDLNLYYRLIDLDEDEMEEIRLSSEKNNIFDYLEIDNFSLDVFGGYQQQKGRYRSLDPMTEFLRIDEGTLYYLTGAPFYIGLDSFYKIEYKGPRLGFRVEASKGKFTTRLGCAYALLKTKAYGWWNVRNYAFWQTGKKKGYGIDVGVEMTYEFTPHLSAGLGFNYIYLRQQRLKETGVYYLNPAWNYDDLDIIRNANSKIYGPSFILKFSW